MSDKIINIDKSDNYRIVVISDVHGHKDLLVKLIEKVDLSDGDYLIILGDFINRGIDSFETYKYVQELSLRKNTIILKGNHESWMQFCFTDVKWTDNLLGHIKNGLYETLIGNLIEKNGIDINTLKHGKELHDLLYHQSLDIL